MPTMQDSENVDRLQMRAALVAKELATVDINIAAEREVDLAAQGSALCRQNSLLGSCTHSSIYNIV